MTGTYDILYEDGDSEQRVGRSLIRTQASGEESDFYGDDFSDERSVATKKDDSDEYSVDDFDATRKSGGSCVFVETACSGGLSWLLVVSHLILHLDEKGVKGTVESFETGDDIEARYKGKDKWYKGMIAAVNKTAGKAAENCTYDVLYEDGDTENEVRLTCSTAMLL